MSFHRNRLYIADLSATSRQDFVQNSTHRPSPFSDVSPIPKDISRPTNLSPPDPPGRIRAFRKRQLCRLRPLIAGMGGLSAAWYSDAPPELSLFHRSCPMHDWAAIMQFFELRGPTWLSRFAHGFSISGMISRKFDFPLTSGELPTRLSRATALPSAHSRFASRSSRLPFGGISLEGGYGSSF